MWFFEKIKRYLGIRKALPEARMQDLNGIDYGIEQYLYNLMHMKGKLEDYDSYIALRCVNANKSDKSKTDEAYDMSIAKLAASRGLDSITQFRIPPKYRIFTTIEDNDKIKKFCNGAKRYYINLKHEKEKQLLEKYIDKYKEKDIHIKLMTKEAILERERNDKFIIYAREEQEEEVYRVLREIYEENPEIFQGADIRNPFLKKGKLEFVSEAPNTDRDTEYCFLNGKRNIVKESYNGLIAMALKDSILALTGKEDFSESVNMLRKEKMSDIIKPVKNYLITSFRNNKLLDASMFDTEKNTKLQDKYQFKSKQVLLKRDFDQVNLLESESNIEGLKKYIISYSTENLNISRTIYSEGIDFDLIESDPKYAQMVGGYLLQENRIVEKESLALEYGIRKGVSYVGTIGKGKNGEYEKMAEMRKNQLDKMYKNMANQENENDNNKLK